MKHAQRDERFTRHEDDVPAVISAHIGPSEVHRCMRNVLSFLPSFFRSCDHIGPSEVHVCGTRTRFRGTGNSCWSLGRT